MSGLNKVMLIGRLGKDPEVRSTQAGNVANFSIATSESWKDKTTGEKKESTEWHNLVVWNNLADIAGKYLRKGDQVYVEGKMKTRSWEKDGVTKYITEVQVSNLVMLSTKKQENQAPRQNTQQSGNDDLWETPSTPKANQVAVDTSTDDLPF